MGNFINSSPLDDVHDIVAMNIDGFATLFLTKKSIRELMKNPDTRDTFKRDWKFLFQVDRVKNSETEYDYVEISEDRNYS